ncbi:MAG: outer membrane beta-barrel protein [Myxococcaceae bacterium]
MKKGLIAGAAALVLWAVPALAQTYEEPRSAKMKGGIAEVGGGIEAYTGSLAPVINPGPTWAARLGVKPNRILGLELAYTGAVNDLDTDSPTVPSTVSGPDLMRNGGQAVATVGLADIPVQPYLMAGVGLSRYTFRGETPLGFDDDTTGNIPMGAGIRGHWGSFTADARFGYNVLFSQDFAPAVPGRNSFSTGRWDGTINVGATF